MGNNLSHLSTDSYRRVRVLAIISASLLCIRYSRLHHPLYYPRLAALNDRLKRYQPFHLLLLSLLSAYVVSRLSLLLTLNAPIPSLTTEPDMHYSPEFSRSRYFLTAFDAAILSTAHIPFAPLRHLLSSILGVWYIVNKHQAERKVHLFRSAITIERIRAMWDKGSQQPLLRFLNSLTTPTLPVQCQSVTIRSSAGHAIRCCLFYSKPLSCLSTESSLVLDFPGGGFVSMPPECHMDYLSLWASKLGVPLLSVDYSKAPERPYPAGLMDCWDVYQQLVETEGSVIGMNHNTSHGNESEARRPLRIALVGDSSGGNLAAAVTLKAIDGGVRLPAGVHLIYPCLDFVSPVWREADACLPPALPTVVAVTDENESVVVSTVNGTAATSASPAQFQLSSRSLHLHDAVLPALYQMEICRSYLSNGGDPFTDYLISPLRAPPALLAHFPPLYIHVGEVDPLLDDSVAFVSKVRRATIARRWVGELVVVERVSHAYLHMTGMLQEGREAVGQSERWLRAILQDDERETVKEL